MYPFNTLLRSLEVLRRDTKPQGLIFLLSLFGVDYVVTFSTCSCKKKSARNWAALLWRRQRRTNVCTGWRKGVHLYVATPAKGEIDLSSTTRDHGWFFKPQLFPIKIILLKRGTLQLSNAKNLARSVKDRQSYRSSKSSGFENRLSQSPLGKELI